MPASSDKSGLFLVMSTSASPPEQEGIGLRRGAPEELRLSSECLGEVPARNENADVIGVSRFSVDNIRATLRHCETQAG